MKRKNDQIGLLLHLRVISVYALFLLAGIGLDIMLSQLGGDEDYYFFYLIVFLSAMHRHVPYILPLFVLFIVMQDQAWKILTEMLVILALAEMFVKMNWNTQFFKKWIGFGASLVGVKIFSLLFIALAYGVFWHGYGVFLGILCVLISFPWYSLLLEKVLKVA